LEISLTILPHRILLVTLGLFTAW